jgi:dipeptidyl aminopeptidase/acylaminoacyl peptidase
MTKNKRGEISVVSVARDLTPGDYDAPVFSLGGQDDYAFSPDGKELCYASNHDAMPAASTNNDLFTVPVDWPADATSAQVIAATKNITAENKAADNTPLYSPGGKYIAYRAQQRPGYESDRFRLMLYDRKTGEKTNLTDNVPTWIGTFTWSTDSRHLFFVTEERGMSPLYSVDLTLKSGKLAAYFVSPRMMGGFNDDLAVVPDGNHLLFNAMSLRSPNEINITYLCPQWCDPLPPPKQLTHLDDDEFSRIAMSPLEPFWFTGAHSDKVEGFLVKPPNFDPNKKYPVKFLIHGGPESAWGDDWSYRWNPELFVANG